MFVAKLISCARTFVLHFYIKVIDNVLNLSMPFVPKLYCLENQYKGLQIHTISGKAMEISLMVFITHKHAKHNIWNPVNICTRRVRTCLRYM